MHGPFFWPLLLDGSVDLELCTDHFGFQMSPFIISNGGYQEAAESNRFDAPQMIKLSFSFIDDGSFGA